MIFTPTLFATIVLVAASVTALPVDGSVEARGISDKAAINIASNVGKIGKDFFDKASAAKPASGPGFAATIPKPAAPAPKPAAPAVPKIPAAPALPKAASILDKIPADVFKAAKSLKRRMEFEERDVEASIDDLV